MFIKSATTLGALGLFVLLVNCTGDSLPCEDTKTCASAGPTTDGGGDVVVPDGCDLTVDPKDAPNCVDESIGIFVDATKGSEGAAGTRAAPLKSIQEAASRAKVKQRVFVCEGTYPESVKLTVGASIAGGYDCSSWRYSEKLVAISATSTGPALEIASGADPSLIADLTVTAAPGGADNTSSIAIFAHNSKTNAFRIKATAKDAANGADSPAIKTNYDISLIASSPVMVGYSASGTKGADANECSTICADNQHARGGAGGSGTLSPTAGEAGTPNRGGGLGGQVANCNASTEAGGTGLPGEDGATPTLLGDIDATGWHPASGAAGKNGGPGQGGGGGGGKADPTFGAGGGGGCGGCGGSAGVASTGGGSSIAFLVLNGEVTIANSTLISGAAGKGGNGVAGQDGQIGGNGGMQTSGGCQGGDGGKGGRGGASAGGAGGISAGVVFKGSKPILSNSTATPGTKGSKGTGGKPNVNDGLDGQAIDVFEVK